MKTSTHKKHEHRAENKAIPAHHKAETKESAAEKEVKKETAKKTPGAAYPVISAIIIVVLLALIIFLLLRKPGTPPATVDKVKVEFYVMSQCPYGTQVENAIGPVLESMGEAIDFHLDYIVSETNPGTFQSLHGAKEVTGNIVQLCAIKYYPENYKYMKMILCQNKDAGNVDTNWEACAKENGMDVEKLKVCLNGDEGKTLLRESMKKADERQARGSPTIYINDIAYQGQRDSLSFQRAICRFSEHSACSSVPKCASDADCTEQPTKDGYCINPGQPNAVCEYKDPVKVDYVVLTSSKCGSSCDPSNIVAAVQQIFLGAVPKIVDADSAEGKDVVQKYGVEKIPAFIFDKAVEQTKMWQARDDLKTAFELKDDKYKLLDEVTGASYFVSEEKRKEYYDAIGVVTGDNKPQIDFFVMSYCPYGNQAEEGIEPVYQLLKDKAVFKPHYVIYENYGGGGPNYCIDNGKLCSMHGIQELNQNVREACVNKHMGVDRWFAFALAMNKDCNSQNADTCWEAVATKLKLDVNKIKTCEKNEAVALMSADKALGDKLGVSGSPTVFVEGDAYSGARTPEGYKTGLCARFDTAPSECSTTLAGSTATNAATATGGCG